MPERISVRKTWRLRPLLARLYSLPTPPDPQATLMEDVMMAILWEDAPHTRARLAFENLTDEFVDWNELRVSLTSEVASVLESCGLKGNKAPALKRVLAKGIERFYSFEFERLRSVPRKRLRAWFAEIEGLPLHLMAAILYWVFRYDRVLVDEEIARVLRRLGLVSETGTLAAIETGLAKVVPAKEAQFIYRALRQHARQVCKKINYDCTTCPLRKECAHGKQRFAEIAAAEAATVAKERARAKARAKAKKKRKRAKAARRKTARRAPAARPAAKRTKKATPKKPAR